jgi:hypothetical protein
MWSGQAVVSMWLGYVIGIGMREEWRKVLVIIVSNRILAYQIVSNRIKSYQYDQENRKLHLLW